MADNNVNAPARSGGNPRRYSFRSGARIRGVTAEAAARELERIRSRSALTPEAVVTSASDPANPLHPAFDWNDQTAAHEHRLQQARQLIRAVHVQIEESRVPEPVFVHVTIDEPRYERVEIVVQTQSLLDNALSELRSKLLAAQRSVNQLVRAAQAANDPEALGRASRVQQQIDSASKEIGELDKDGPDKGTPKA